MDLTWWNERKKKQIANETLRRADNQLDAAAPIVTAAEIKKLASGVAAGTSKPIGIKLR